MQQLIKDKHLEIQMFQVSLYVPSDHTRKLRTKVRQKELDIEKKRKIIKPNELKSLNGWLRLT